MDDLFKQGYDQAVSDVLRNIGEWLRFQPNGAKLEMLPGLIGSKPRFKLTMFLNSCDSGTEISFNNLDELYRIILK